MLWISLGFITCSRNMWGTSHWILAVELAILGLWVPPIYYVASDIANASGDPISKSTEASLTMFTLNM